MSQPEQVQDLEVAFGCDGERQVRVVPPFETLLETLRNRVGVTSVRGTCGIGLCGTCTVLLDGKPVSSCLTLTAQIRDREVTTAEGLRTGAGRLGPVQRAFIDRGAYQCSFCIPAMTLGVQGALNDPEVGATVEDVREYLGGNLCRCGTYPQILRAVTDMLAERAYKGGVTDR